jgi:solute carrier family 25 carnitine/acylcarnitine transporter 20/29
LTVYREEGIGGFFRGIWIPLCTISIVREFWWLILDIVLLTSRTGAASFTIYGGTKEYLKNHQLLYKHSLAHVGGSGGLGGALAGAIISFGSAREFLVCLPRYDNLNLLNFLAAFELVKVSTTSFGLVRCSVC